MSLDIMSCLNPRNRVISVLAFSMYGRSNLATNIQLFNR